MNILQKYDKFIQTKINGVSEKDYNKKKPVKQWFSWGWLIFWIIVCFPIAFLYLMLKIGEKK